MAASGDKVLRTDITGYYSSLNSMRTRFSLGTITVPTIDVGTSATAAQINALGSAMSTAYSAARNKNFNNVASFTSFNVTAGTKILANLDTNIEAILSGWNSACVNKSNNGTFGDFGDFNTNSTNSTNGTDGTCSEGGYTYGDDCANCPDCSWSTKRVKTNINGMTEEDANKLLQVEIVNFDYIEGFGAKNQQGIIAEDVLNILPSVVNIPEGYDVNNDNDLINILSVNYTKFIPYLIKLCQIQQAEIDLLKKKMEKMEYDR